MDLRIDGHTHIFTLRTILSREAIRVMTQRIRDLHERMPAQFVDALERVLYRHYERPYVFDERRWLSALLRQLPLVGGAPDRVRDLLPPGVELGSDYDDLPAAVLLGALETYANRHDAGVAKAIMNVIAALRQATRPTITEIADDILRDMEEGNPGEDHAIVALMMDIYGADNTPYDRHVYRGQIEGTREAVLQRPGRILPFFGVHPDRPETLDELKAATESGAFVGVKLYPSLGYAVDSDRMREIYRHCLRAQLPVLLHCGHGGFYRSKAAIDQCDPEQWRSIIESDEFADLRVCFAHFGGWETLGRGWHDEANWPPPDQREPGYDYSWGRTILEFMEHHPNVFTDLAKHAEMFPDPATRDRYFDTLRTFLDDPDIGARLLYGTDAWLLRLDMEFSAYLRLWKAAAGSTYDAITRDGPQRFLGFHGDDPAGWGENLRRYVAFLAEHRDRVGAEPADWLAAAVGEAFSVTRDLPGWDGRKHAVRDTYQFLGRYMPVPVRQRGFRAHRDVTLRELTYFDPRNPTFEAQCRDLARQFVTFLSQRTGYVQDHTFDSVVDLFIGVFRSGRLTLGGTAGAVDTVFAYEEHVV